MIKRAIDMSISLVLLCCCIPIAIPIAIIIRLKMGSPILFCQQRPGLGGKPFKLYKFRTMVIDSLGEDEHRLTQLGEILRKYSLDEIPQLYNVIRGDMSLVGPRPLLKEYLPLYSAEQRIRHDVKPGITGWAQVNGRNALSWEEKFQLDTWYVNNYSVWLDFMILALTIKKVFRSEGISQPGYSTAQKFKGTKTS
jgi:sugar transferase EpsL